MRRVTFRALWRRLPYAVGGVTQFVTARNVQRPVPPLQNWHKGALLCYKYQMKERRACFSHSELSRGCGRIMHAMNIEAAHIKCSSLTKHLHDFSRLRIADTLFEFQCRVFVDNSSVIF